MGQSWADDLKVDLERAIRSHRTALSRNNFFYPQTPFFVLQLRTSLLEALRAIALEVVVVYIRCLHVGQVRVGKFQIPLRALR